MIKYGGSLLDDRIRESLFLKQLVQEWKTRRNHILLVHGGGKEITRKMELAGIKTKFIGGRRYTDSETMNFVEKTLRGLNSKIVKKLISLDAKAEGYSGRYNHLLEAEIIPDLGRVGHPKSSGVRTDLLSTIVKKETLPVFYPIGEDASGQPLNINADDFAQSLAIALGANELIFLTDTGGVLDKSGAVIPQINPAGADRLIQDETITGGMEVKIKACLQAISHGVGKVIIGETVLSDAQGLHVKNGTAIVKEGPTVNAN